MSASQAAICGRGGTNIDHRRPLGHWGQRSDPRPQPILPISLSVLPSARLTQALRPFLISRDTWTALVSRKRQIERPNMCGTSCVSRNNNNNNTEENFSDILILVCFHELLKCESSFYCFVRDWRLQHLLSCGPTWLS